MRVVLSSSFPSFGDPKDEHLLALLRDGAADVLVTGDRALISLGRFEQAEILTARTFTERLQEHTE